MLSSLLSHHHQLFGSPLFAVPEHHNLIHGPEPDLAPTYPIALQNQGDRRAKRSSLRSTGVRCSTSDLLYSTTSSIHTNHSNHFISIWGHGALGLWRLTHSDRIIGIVPEAQPEGPLTFSVFFDHGSMLSKGALAGEVQID